MTVRSDRWHRNVALAQLGAYLLIVTVGVIGFARSEQQDAKIEEAQASICEQAQANREATRNLVIAIEALGRQLVLGDGDKPTPQQVATLKVFKEFRDQQLTLLAGPVCP